MKKAIKWFIAITFYYSGMLIFYRRLLKPLFTKNNLIILRYHRVLDTNQKDPINISVRRDSFERQMNYLRKHYKVERIEDIVDRLGNGKSFAVPTLGITFDDGYKNNHTFAFPVLQNLNLPAMIFITLNYINTSKVFSWDKGVWGEDARCATDMLTWEEIGVMKAGGVSFGSHTLTHPKLDKIELSEARREIFQSKEMLGQRLSTKVDIFSYPHGDHDEEVKGLVKSAGYKAAFSTDDGLYQADIDMFALKRKAIHESLTASPFGKFSKAIFALEIEGIFDWLFRRKNTLSVS